MQTVRVPVQRRQCDQLPCGGSSTSQTGHQCSVNCKQRAPVECKSGSNDFDAALIQPGDINVEISKPDVESNGGSSLAANASSSAL